MDEIPRPDVVIVCCGGGGLLSGVAAGIKLKGSESTRIFGVEPEGGACYFIFPRKYPYLSHLLSLEILIWWGFSKAKIFEGMFEAN